MNKKLKFLKYQASCIAICNESIEIIKQKIVKAIEEHREQDREALCVDLDFLEHCKKIHEELMIRKVA